MCVCVCVCVWGGGGGGGGERYMRVLSYLMVGVAVLDEEKEATHWLEGWPSMYVCVCVCP